MRWFCFLQLALVLGGSLRLIAQNVFEQPSQPARQIPGVLEFHGSALEADGSAPTGMHGITFALYRDQTGGIPLWVETQSVSLDSQGRYTALLGTTTAYGVPPSVFGTAEPKWIGTILDDGTESPRIELASVPYAFKAADSDTLGGKPPSEFVTQQQWNSLLAGLKAPTTIPIAPVSFLPEGGPLEAQNSSVYAQLGQSNSFAATQHFPGGIDLPASGLEANSTGTLDSAPLDFESSIQDSQTTSPLTQRFRWVSQPPRSGGNTSVMARLGMYYGVNGVSPTSTGLSINADGTINFAANQQLPSGAVVSALSGNGSNGTGSASDNPIVNTAAYSWTQTPPQGVGALQVGAGSVTLTPCPKGVNGTDVYHYLYVSGTGTPEVVLITGGSCTSRASTGTIEFTAIYAHPSGYSISSATDGVQEAVIDASVNSFGGQVSRQVMIDPGQHLFRARLSIRSSGTTVTSSGATIICAMSDTCIFVGDPFNANSFSNIQLSGLRVFPRVPKGTWSAVEDNANGSTIDGLAPAPGATNGASFGHLIQVDNDQAASINNLSTITNYNWGRCDKDFCSSAVFGPGPYSTNAGVIWVNNSNLSLQGFANGIDNQDGNSLNVNNSVIQGYAQFGIRSRTVYLSSTVQISNVLFEDDSNANPSGLGSAGLIVEGGEASSANSQPVGVIPQFSATGNMQYIYYIVVNSTAFGTSPLYLAGYANTSGVGQIRVAWNQIGTAGIISYDVLRIVGNYQSAATTPPLGTGAFAVATGVPATTSCVNLVCSVIDDAAVPPSSYTIPAVSFYWPALTLWPGNVILTQSSDYQNTGGGVPTQYYANSIKSGGIVSSAGGFEPSVFAQECNPQSNWSPIWMQCVGGNAVSNDNPPIVGTVLQLAPYGGAAGGLKGRQIFEMDPSSGLGATEIITLMDSNFVKTMSTPGNRPSWDALDTYLGVDQPPAYPSGFQLAFGAPVAVSEYIGHVPDGVSWLERLTGTGKLFRVPVQLTQIGTGTADNTDAMGTLFIVGATTGTYVFSGKYLSAPGCNLTPMSDPTNTGAYWVTVTSSGVTANVTIPGNISFTYQCWFHT